MEGNENEEDNPCEFEMVLLEHHALIKDLIIYVDNSYCLSNFSGGEWGRFRERAVELGVAGVEWVKL